MFLGRDNGVTEISFKNLKKIYNEKRKLEKVLLFKSECHFHFSDNAVYVAAGFKYGQTGSEALALGDTIRLWYQDKISNDFSKTTIANLDKNRHYMWTLEEGFRMI